jgi:hypothetical protein
MIASSGRRTECWKGVCSCAAGFKPTPSQDCVEASKSSKHISLCNNRSQINYTLSVFSVFLLFLAETFFRSGIIGPENSLPFKMLLSLS